MRQVFMLLTATALMAGPALAQRGPGEPPPDHWLTVDSLLEIVQITAEQRDTITQHYELLNEVVKEAAEQRQALRAEMGGGRPGPGARERFMEFRQKLQVMQQQIDEHYAAIQNLLTDQQRERFDALPKPRVMFQRRRR